MPTLSEMTAFTDDLFKHQVSLPNQLADDPDRSYTWIENLHIVPSKVTLLTGESGTGKTLAGLYKAYQWGQLSRDVVFVTLYRHKAVYLNMLFKEKQPPFQVTYLSKFESTESPIDFLIIDDAHDFKMETLKNLVKRTRSKVLLCANSLPISPYTHSDALASSFGIMPVKLQTNWRLSRQHLCITDRLMTLHLPSSRRKNWINWVAGLLRTVCTKPSCSIFGWMNTASRPSRRSSAQNLNGAKRRKVCSQPVTSV